MPNEFKVKNITIGTAGHVDHGKTTLIRALTGIDADRLKEEKERGMTIDLGFAWLTLPTGERVGIVDVPGHERFLKNMLAGATGIDIALLVIAADEGIMPQTREHLDILKILETRRGIVALTKIDMVEEEWVPIVEDDIRVQLSGSFFENSPIIPVSSQTGAGVDELRSEIVKLVIEASEKDRNTSGGFRLPIDRVFTLTGFGTVVTGTLASGAIRVGDTTELLPNGIQTRARQLQVHGHKVEEVLAGTRAAVNLAGVEVHDIQRGDVCAAPGLLKPSLLIDVHLSLLSDSPIPLENRKRVRLHTGTSEVLGRMILLDAQRLQPGQEAFAQFRAETLLVVSNGDRFVLRSYSPMHTIGGGVILDSAARKHHAGDESLVHALKARLAGTPEDVATEIVRNAGLITAQALAASANWPESTANEALSALASEGKVVILAGGLFADASGFRMLSDRVICTLEDFHVTHSSKTGMSKEDLERQTSSVGKKKMFLAVIAELQNEKTVNAEGNLIRMTSHTPRLSDSQIGSAQLIENRYQNARFTAPTEQELMQSVEKQEKDVKEIIEWLLASGRLVKIEEGLYLHKDTISDAEKLLRDYLSANPNITVSQFRDITGSSRKYAVPLLEYFDGKRITRRMGDIRVLLGQKTG